MQTPSPSPSPPPQRKSSLALSAEGSHSSVTDEDSSPVVMRRVEQGGSKKDKRVPRATSNTGMELRSPSVTFRLVQGEGGEGEYELDSHDLDDAIHRILKARHAYENEHDKLDERGLSAAMTQEIGIVADRMRKRRAPESSAEDSLPRLGLGEVHVTMPAEGESEGAEKFKRAVGLVMGRMRELRESREEDLMRSSAEATYSQSGGSDSDSAEEWGVVRSSRRGRRPLEAASASMHREDPTGSSPVFSPNALKLTEQLLAVVDSHTNPAPTGVFMAPPPSQGQQGLGIMGTMQALFAKYLPNNGKWTFGLAILAFALITIIDSIVRASSDTVLDSLEEDVAWTPIAAAIVFAAFGLSIDCCRQKKHNDEEARAEEDVHLHRLAQASLKEQAQQRLEEELRRQREQSPVLYV